MAVYHDEIEIEDFEYDEDEEIYYYPCPCGDRFQISKVHFFCLYLGRYAKVTSSSISVRRPKPIRHSPVYHLLSYTPVCVGIVSYEKKKSPCVEWHSFTSCVKVRLDVQWQPLTAHRRVVVF